VIGVGEVEVQRRSVRGPSAVRQRAISSGSVFSTLLIDRVIEASATVPADRVLDVGCGQAPYRDLMSPSFYVGVDRTHRPGGAAVVADVGSLPVAAASFDGILCTEVIEHVPDERLLARELARVARPGAVLVLSSPFVHALHEQPYDYRRLTSIGLVEVLSEAGWVVESVASIGGPLVVAVDSAARWADSLLRRSARVAFGANRPPVRWVTALSASLQRAAGAVALISPFSHLRVIDAYAPAPRLTLGYVVRARMPERDLS
jgi:SAM-dependent methyltransferase